MGVFGTVWDGLKSLLFANSNSKGKGSAPSLPIQGADPRPYLSGAAPGMWATNHLAESQQCRGWQYVATQTVARMASQAELQVHFVGEPVEQKRRAKKALKIARLIGDRRTERQMRRILRKSGEATAQGGTKVDRTPVGGEDAMLRLLQRPNPEWSLNTFLFVGAQQIALTATALVWRVRGELGVPTELYILPTGLTTPQPPTADFPMGSYYLAPPSAFGVTSGAGELWVNGMLGRIMLTGAEIDARDVKPIRWPHPIHLCDGLSPLAAGAVWVDVSNELDRSCWYGLQNSERPGMIFGIDTALPVDPDPDDIIRFREDLKAENAGVSNSRKHLFLPKGVTHDERSRSPSDMDYPNGRTQYRDANLALHSVSPVAAGISEAGSYAAYWASIKQTTELSIQPVLSLIAGELTEFLGSEFDGPRRELSLNARAIDDPQLLESRLKTDIQAGNVLTVDEYRTMRGYAHLGGERGKAFAGAKAAAPLLSPDAKGKGKEEEPDDGGDQDGDSDADGSGTGVRQEDRDAPPGRQDRDGKRYEFGRNGSHKTNGR